MNVTLQRRLYHIDGIISDATDTDTGRAVATTLEHSYPGLTPKVPAGEYTCVRGTHQLHNGVPFETFEVTGVDGHSGILFHQGNFNDDSEGCILVGRSLAQGEHNGEPCAMITESKTTFFLFMQDQKDVDEFTLTVVA